MSLSLSSHRLKSLIDAGLPVRVAHFHAAVNNAYNVPVHNLSAKADKKDNKAEMWDTPAGLIVRQNGIYLRVPEATVMFVHYTQAVNDEMAKAWDDTETEDAATPRRRRSKANEDADAPQSA